MLCENGYSFQFSDCSKKGFNEFAFKLKSFHPLVSVSLLHSSQIDINVAGKHKCN